MNIIKTTYWVIACVWCVIMGFILATKINTPEIIEINTNNNMVCEELLNMHDKIESYDNQDN